MRKVIRIGTRDSKLAVAQAMLLQRHIQTYFPEYEAVLVKMKTAGDRILDRNLEEIGGKGLFVKELDAALYEGRTDLSVHSLKDMPMEIQKDYPILGFSHREEPEDALVLAYGCNKPDWNMPIGTSSPRRRIQLAQLYPGCRVQPVRGNLLTRLQKLDDGQYGALVLAAAGLRRLGLEHRIYYRYPVMQMVPAAGQGILAVQGRKDFDRRILEGFFDADARWQAIAERSFVKAFGGGCACPTAAHAILKCGRITLIGLTGTKDGTMRKAMLTAPKQEAEQLGKRLAELITEKEDENDVCTRTSKGTYNG